MADYVAAEDKDVPATAHSEPATVPPVPAAGTSHWIRRLVLTGAGHAVAPVLFRLWAGRWPSRVETGQFARGLRAPQGGLSVIPRAVNAVAATDDQLASLLFQRLIAAGRLPEYEEHGPTPQAGNPLAFWEGPPLAFLHFEKTGGSALVAALAARFHPLQITCDDSVRGGRGEPPALAAADIRLRRRPFIWGHFNLPELHAAAPAHALLTLLREPRSRILSLYHFWRSIRPEHVPALADPRVEAAQSCTLLDFLRLPHPDVQATIDNVYVRRLTGANIQLGGYDPLRAQPDSVVQNALEALGAFAWIGLLHRFDADLATLAQHVGQQLTRPPSAENRRARNPIDRPLLYRTVAETQPTDAEEAALDRLTEYDAIIFRQVQAMAA